jgi:small-conductance mechanosensitive channel
MEFLGLHLVGLNATTGTKILLTLAVIAGVTLASFLLRSVLRLVPPHGGTGSKVRFWGRQVVSIVIAVTMLLGLASIWFDNPKSMATALGLFTAGLGFALQKVITALAGYLLILRGNNFTVGDRIVMGGVRGNVIALGFFQTTIMEMGQPPSVQAADPAMWVKSRQFTGRIVTVSNSLIFDAPVYNYTRDFPFIWDEITLPIAYRDDREKAEKAILEATQPHAVDPQKVAPETLEHLRSTYDLEIRDFAPRVFWRISDNWLEMTVRLLVPDHDTRQIKDSIARDLMARLDAAGIGIASATSEIVGLPPVRVEMSRPRAALRPDA